MKPRPILVILWLVLLALAGLQPGCATGQSGDLQRFREEQKGYPDRESRKQEQAAAERHRKEQMRKP